MKSRQRISGELKQLAKQQGTVVLAVSGTSRAVAAEPIDFVQPDGTPV